MTEVRESINKSWKSTMKVLLGAEVGDIDNYSEWLSEGCVPLKNKKSAKSNKEVYCAVSDYEDNAKFISLDEIDYGQKFEPLNINEIKDIDSIIEALEERVYYCGNVVLGNSKHVEKSSDVQNSFYVYNSNFIYDSEYMAYCSYCRGSKYLFGVVSDAFTTSTVRAFETHKQSRCLEAWKCYDSSDCYFSSCVQGSQDVLFSFNLKNKRNVIGNIQLTKEKYLSLKEKLIEDLKIELEIKKKLPSLMEIASKSCDALPVPKNFNPSDDKEQKNKGPIELGFQKTTSLLFNNPLSQIDNYKGWLLSHVPYISEEKSSATGKPVYLGETSPFHLYSRDRLVTQWENWALGENLQLDGEDIESLSSLKKSIGKIAYFNPEGQLGETKNLIMVPLCNTSVNCYYCPIASFNENVAFSYWPRHSKYVYGCGLSFTSNFCIHTYYSMNLSRAFEVDASNNCSDIYFAHNCENVRDSMFCFNAKNLRFAIGNGVLPQDKFKSIKSTVLAQIVDDLEKRKSIPWSIFNLGGRGSKLWHSKLMA
ncbi:MAG: hypothetical protein ABH842_02655 [Candidatus Micrarchaeota archaeon]